MPWRNNIFAVLLFIAFAGNAQEAKKIPANLQQDVPKGWHLLDSKTDSFFGISLNKTYSFLKNKTSKPVIVAVIDSGVDTTHEDLKNIFWKNPKEIPGNGIDDDGNGYTDDVYGWNFLGGKDGRNVRKTPPEVSRIYHRLKEKYEHKNINEDTLSASAKEEYAMWKKATKELEVDEQSQIELMFLEVVVKGAKKQDNVLKAEMNTEEYTSRVLEKFEPKTMQARQAKMGFLNFVKILELDPEETNKALFNDIDEYIQVKKDAAEAKETPPVLTRYEIVKDDYQNINDRFYGNNDVMGPDSRHGTHVSGIIAAERNNKTGIDGVADNVKIMIIRAVPDGDEYDKDIAVAIRYAVDNGAKIINMSFGKSLSPEKKWVDDAVKYAEAKDVLLVHAAGNDSEDNDEKENYPSPDLKNHTRITNVITVGASTDLHIKGEYVAEFSNYGKTTVDVFAPGVKIYSTVNGGNTYANLQGTSMAAPVVSGVAGLLRSYYPTLTAKQVKYVIEKSVMSGDTVWVNKPGSKEKVSMQDLCTSGGWVNAYNAVVLASSIIDEKAAAEKKEVKKDGTKKEMLPVSTFKNIKVKH